MSKRYTDAEKQAVLLRLDQNGGDIVFTAEQLNISARTLRYWRRERRRQQQQHAQNWQQWQPSLPESMSPSSAATIARFQVLRDKLMDSTSELVDAIIAGIDEATISQCATTLNQVLSSIAKLNAYLPPDDEEQQEFRLTYENAKTGEISETPPEPDDDLDE